MNLLIKLVLLDLVMSRDNMMLLGAVISKLPCRRRSLILTFSGVGIIISRLILASFIFMISGYISNQVFLLLLLLIASTHCLKMLKQKASKTRTNLDMLTTKIFFSTFICQRARWTLEGRVNTFLRSILFIIGTNALASVDNTVALGALTTRNLLILIMALCISTTILLCASIALAQLVQYIPQLLTMTMGSLTREVIIFCKLNKHGRNEEQSTHATRG